MPIIIGQSKAHDIKEKDQALQCLPQKNLENNINISMSLQGYLKIKMNKNSFFIV
jgi:hypothetical protein